MASGDGMSPPADLGHPFDDLQLSLVETVLYYTFLRDEGGAEIALSGVSPEVLARCVDGMEFILPLAKAELEKRNKN